MIREHLFHARAPADPMFRWRGGDISRVEGFSDGVFAVTLSLLIFSSSVPTTYYEIWRTARDFPAFVASYALLLFAWYYHYQFFRRYGLEDVITITLNGVFLFLILFFAYPLKFLALFLWSLILRESTRAMFTLPPGVVADHPWVATEFGQRTGMMVFYGVGLVGVFGVLAMMVLRAYRLRDQLELDALERHLTRVSLAHHLVMVFVALLSLLALRFARNPGISGVVYFLTGPLQAFVGAYGRNRAVYIQRELTAKSTD